MKNKKIIKIIILLLLSSLILSTINSTSVAKKIDKKQIMESYDLDLESFSSDIIFVDDIEGYDTSGSNPPEDYTSIQDAIKFSDTGDVIFVFKGKYQENIVIDEQIVLLGESVESTIIDGNGSSNVVTVTANSVQISGFTIKNSGEVNSEYENSAIDLKSNYNIISNNKLIDNKGNGVMINSSDYNQILKNLISGNEHGVILKYSVNNTVSNNIIRGNQFGVCLFESDDNKVKINLIQDNNVGMCANNASDNNITSNDFLKNSYGMFINSSSNNLITKNNFVDSVKRKVQFRGFCKNLWDGNFWNRARLLPKIIFGRAGKLGLIPFFDIDMHPAKSVYIIQPIF